jgi:hypothetical protein
MSDLQAPLKVTPEGFINQQKTQKYLKHQTHALACWGARMKKAPQEGLSKNSDVAAVNHRTSFA